MFGRNQQNKSFFRDFLRNIKNSSLVLKNLFFLLITLVVAFWINSESNPIKTYLYNLGYEIYGQTSQTIYNLSNQLKFCEADSVNEEVLNEKKYLEQKNSTLENELKLIKSQIKFINNQKYNYITAVVTQITYPKDEESLVISAGLKDGISVGNIVINQDGIVGRVASISDKYSVVSLLGNENVKISSVISYGGKDCIVGKKSIEDKKLLEVNYVNDVENLNNNQKVITSGKDGLSPYGIEIGEIKIINGKIFVEINNDPASAKLVSVIINN